MQDPTVHRQLIASIASLKSCIRSFVLALQPQATADTAGDAPQQQPSQAQQQAAKIPGSLSRASDVTASLRKMLCAVSDQTLSLPLETSRRLVEVELPELLQQLLASCSPSSLWPQADSNDLLPALAHPCWEGTQQLVADVFEVLSLICGVAVRACTRSTDPLMVLVQLTSPKVMAAATSYMQQLWQAHEAAVAAAPDTQQAEGAQQAGGTAASHAFAGAVAAFSGCYSLLAAAVDAQQGLEQLEMQLAGSLCSTGFLPVAVQLLLAATSAAGAHSGGGMLQLHCQRAGWQLLTLTLFLSGGDIALNPNSAEVQVGQHIPSSVLAARMRQEAVAPAAAGVGAAVAAAAAASAASAAKDEAAGLPVAAMQEQLLAPQVLLFLQERLYHAVKEMRGNSGGSSSGLAGVARPSSPELLAAALAGGPQEQQPLPLLPGRCVPDDQDVLAAALRTLRCWHALLASPAGPCLPLASSRGVALLLAVLNGALAESIKDGSSQRQALRGRLVRVAVHCLQLLCGCVGPDVLGEQLHGLTSALSSVVGAGGAYWDSHKRAIKSADLPYTGQVRCVDKGTGDMLVRYTMAAQGALVVLRQLLAACRAEPGSVSDPESVMLSAGVLPAVEQLFRQIPVASPAHVAAADLLAQLLPLCGTADLACGQLPLLASMRKFLVKAPGIPEPDRTAAIATATKLAEMVARLACHCSGAAAGGGAGVLLQHAAAQLLPAFQVLCTSVLKAGVPAPCPTRPDTGSGITVLAVLGAGGSAPGASCHLYPALLSATQQLVELAVKQPALGLLQLLLGRQALATAAAIIGSSYWATPQVAAAATQPGNASLTAESAAQMVTSMLEAILGAAAPQQAAAALCAGSLPKVLHASISDDCLCAVKLGLECAAACCSPKACSDVTPATSGARLDAAELAQPQQELVQPSQLLSALLDSKLLPQAHRLLQQLPQQGQGVPEVSGRSTGSAAGSGMARQGSASSAVQVPASRSGSQHYSKDAGVRVGGHSPTYSILAGSQPRGQPASSTQQLLSAFTSSELPAYAAVNSSNSGSHALRVSAAHSRYAAGSRRSSDGTAAGGAVAGSSPRAVDGDVGGLLRGGSWSSLQGAWPGQSSAGQADKERIGRQSSSGFSSTASLGSLTVADSLTVRTGWGPGALLLQLRLQSVLLAAGQAVIALADGCTSGGGGSTAAAGRPSTGGSSRVSSSDSSCDGGSGAALKQATASWTAAMPQPPLQLQLQGRSSYSGTGSITSPHAVDSGIDVLAGLRVSLAAVPALAAAVRSPQGVGSPGRTVCAAAEGSSDDALLPVDLGLSQLQLSQQGDAAGGVDNSCAGNLLSDDVLRGVVAGAQAAAPLLSRACPPAADAEQCWQEVLARLLPAPVGCWNAACVNMAGASEAAAPAKPCANCNVASFCSKGCERAAWSGHTLACGKLAAAAAAAAAAATPVTT